MKKSLQITFLFIAFLLVTSCSKHVGDTGKPVYKKNGGDKKETVFNKKKVQMETLWLENIKLSNDLIKTVMEQHVALANTNNLSVVPNLENTVDVVLKELSELSEELNSEITYNKKGLDKIETIQKKLIDLLAQKIGPTSKIIIENSKIKELKSDLVFETGKYKLKPAGVTEISNQVLDLEKKIVDWKQYLDNNGIKIFENDMFKIKISISGFADAQGVGNLELRKKENLELSAKRAESVKNEFTSQLNKLIEKHKLTTDIEFVGMGEELPPNVVDNGVKNNPNRRVCLIVSVVSPSSLLIEK